MHLAKSLVFEEASHKTIVRSVTTIK